MNLVRRLAGLASVLAVAVVPVLAGGPAAAAPSGTITVQVRDRSTGGLVQEFCANATAADFGSGAGACASGGTVTFSDLVDGGQGYLVDVQSPTLAFVFTPANGGLPVQAPADLVVDVDPAGIARAQVSDPTGALVPDAAASIWRVDPVTGELSFEVGVPVDPDGTWFVPLAVGTYTVGYQVPGGEVYPGGATSLETAPRFIVEAGLTTNLDHVITPPDVRPATLAGVVVDAATGARLAGVCLAVRDVAQGGAPDDVCAEAVGRSRADGTFRLSVPAGTLQLFAQDAALSYARTVTDVQAAPGQVVRGLRVLATPAGRLTGRIVDGRRVRRCATCASPRSSGGPPSRPPPRHAPATTAPGGCGDCPPVGSRCGRTATPPT